MWRYAHQHTSWVTVLKIQKYIYRLKGQVTFEIYRSCQMFTGLASQTILTLHYLTQWISKGHMFRLLGSCWLWCQEIWGHQHGLVPLLWRHNGHNGISNHQPHGCLLNRLFIHKSKKTSKLRVIGLCVGNSPVTGEFPTQMASNAENVSIWWRHYAKLQPPWLPWT